LSKDRSVKLDIRQIDLNQYGYNKKILFISDKDEEAKKIQNAKMISLGRLTASIAHEIRNPLSAIYQASQLLKEELGNNKLIDIINNNSVRTNNIVNSVLSISKFQKKQFKNYNIVDWLKNFLNTYYKNELNIINFEYDKEVKSTLISFDSQSLSQVIKNVIDNAIRHSEFNKNLPQKISIYLWRDEVNRTYLDIYDSGTGVREDIIKNLFEPFFTDGDHDGMGLGLFIAKELCLSMNFDINYIADKEEKFFRISFFR
jgi:two-component system sensor histidine kinase PilS (NtrC family)